MDEKRIKGGKYKIRDMQDFFEKRAARKLSHRYSYSIYHDNAPEVAMERDEFEKKKILPFLNMKAEDMILDIGCGVGRWADAFLPLLSSGKYVGVDFSSSVLDIAKEHFGEDDRLSFLRGSFQELIPVLDNASLAVPYDIIMINGVLMYINDDEINDCLSCIKTLLGKNGTVYIKESIGVEERFTLKDFYSDEMKTEYSAIYRSKDEYTVLLDETFDEKNYKKINEGFTWEGINWDRKETESYYWIIRRS